MPYLVSWLLYQGTILMTVLSWTGLIINGMVAFILPMVLAYRCLLGRLEKQKKEEQQQSVGVSQSLSYSHSYDAIGSVTHVVIQDCDGETSNGHSKHKNGTSSYQGGGSVEMTSVAPRRRGMDHPSAGTPHTTSDSAVEEQREQPQQGAEGDLDSTLEEEEQGEGEVVNSVQALPPWMEPVRKHVVLVIITFFTFIISFTIFMDLYTGVAPG